MGAVETPEVAATGREVRPQPGPQELILSTPADIGIIGGSVFGGKTWALAVEPIRHVDVPGFTFVAFRREMPDATNPGGIWDETKKWYPAVGGSMREHVHEWDFPSGAKGKIAQLQYEHSVEDWKSSQVCLFLFDQLETFTERQFFYMLSRNRSTCGVDPYTRGSCNPDPDSFLATFLAWWIDEEGWAIPERSGVIRWCISVEDTRVWATVTCAPEEYASYEDCRRRAIAELAETWPDDAKYALSVTFVLARLQDNAIGNRLDPSYEGKVRAMSRVDRQRLLGGDRGGNWKVRATAGLVFDRAWFEVVEALPTEVVMAVRYFDKAGTQGGGKFSAGVLMLATKAGFFIVADVVRGQWSAHNREKVLKQCADADRRIYGGLLEVWIEQEPGSGGKESAENTVKNLAGHVIHVEKVTGDKVTRAKPFSAQAEAGNVRILRAPWTEEFLKEAHRFDGVHGFTDQIDAGSGAFNKLTAKPAPSDPKAMDIGLRSRSDFAQLRRL
jgi:predicted phage terminase large subunit-like protein